MENKYGIKVIAGGACAAKGFSASGVHCGIRRNRSKKDLALIVSDTPCNAAAVYTRNLVKGAPLEVTREHIAAGKLRLSAVLARLPVRHVQRPDASLKIVLQAAEGPKDVGKLVLMIRQGAGNMLAPAGGQHILVHVAQGVDEASFPQAHEDDDQDAADGKGSRAGPGDHLEAAPQFLGMTGDVAAQEMAEVPALLDNHVELTADVVRRQKVLHGLPGGFGHDVRTIADRHIARGLPGSLADLIGKVLVLRDRIGQQRPGHGGGPDRLCRTDRDLHRFRPDRPVGGKAGRKAHPRQAAALRENFGTRSAGIDDAV